MDIKELRLRLAELAREGKDTEEDHIEADKLLLKYINDSIAARYFWMIRTEKGR